MDVLPDPTPEQQQELRDWLTSQSLQDFQVDATLTDMLAEIPVDAGQTANADNGIQPAAYPAQYQGDRQALQPQMPLQQLNDQNEDHRLKYPESGHTTMPQIFGPLVAEQNETIHQNQANFKANQAIPAAPAQMAETTNESEPFDPSLFMDPAVPIPTHLDQPYFSDLGSAYWKHFDFDYMIMPGEEKFMTPGQKFDHSQQPLLVDPAAFGINLTAEQLAEQLGIQGAQPPAPEFDFEQYCDQLAQAPMANVNAPVPQNVIQDRQFFPVDNATVPGQGYYPIGGFMPSQNPVQNQPFAFNGGFMPQTTTQNQAFDFEMPLMPQPAPAQNNQMVQCLCMNTSSTTPDANEVGFAVYRFCKAKTFDEQAGIGNELESMRQTRLSWMAEDNAAREAYMEFGQSRVADAMGDGTTHMFARKQAFGTPQCTCGAFASNMQAPLAATMPASRYMPQPPAPGSQRYHVGYATVHITGPQDPQGLIDAATSRPVSIPAYTDFKQKTDNSTTGVASLSASEAKHPQQNGQNAAPQDDNASEGKAPVRSESTSDEPTVEAPSSSPSTTVAAVADSPKRKRDEETADALLTNAGDSQPAAKRRVTPPRAEILRALAGDGQPAKRRVTPPRASRKTTSYVEPEEDDIYAPENAAVTEDGKSKKKMMKKVRFDLPADEEADATADAEVDEDTIVVAQRRL